MITVANPWALGVGAVAVVLMSLLHLLSWQRPQPSDLPTARFVPAVSPRAKWRQVSPSDPWVWLMRLLALSAISLAVAGPVVRVPRDDLARVIVADVSRGVAELQEVRDSVAALAQAVGTSRLVAFDSAAHVVMADSLRLAPVRGDLAAGLVRGVREAQELARRHQQVEIVVVSPVVRETQTAGLGGIAESWPGRITLRRVRAASPPGSANLTRGSFPSIDSPVGAALAVSGLHGLLGVTVASFGMTAADSVFARDGGLVIDWSSIAPDTTTRALTNGSRSAIGPWGRDTVPAGEVVLWWADGQPAATQRAFGDGCVRTVGIGLPNHGDFVVRQSLAEVMRTLGSPCQRSDLGVVTGPVSWVHEAQGTSISASVSPNSAVQLGLLLLAVLALLGEMVLRRPRQAPVAVEQVSELRRA